MAKKLSVDRRKFLKGAAAGAAGFVASASAIAAPQALPSQSASAPMMPKEIDPSGVDVLTTERTGSDFMVDVIKSLGLEYIASNPGSSFRALHESLINYGGNESPEFITCCHEESSVAMAHGYAKIEGKPACVFAHGTVGLQHLRKFNQELHAGRSASDATSYEHRIFGGHQQLRHRGDRTGVALGWGWNYELGYVQPGIGRYGIFLQIAIGHQHDG